MRIELNRHGDWPTAREAERADETSVKMDFFFLLFETWPFLREASFSLNHKKAHFRDGNSSRQSLLVTVRHSATMSAQSSFDERIFDAVGLPVILHLTENVQNMSFKLKKLLAFFITELKNLWRIRKIKINRLPVIHLFDIQCIFDIQITRNKSNKI